MYAFSMPIVLRSAYTSATILSMTGTTSIRLSEQEKEQAQEKAEAYGLPSLAALIRFAIKKLPTPARSE